MADTLVGFGLGLTGTPKDYTSIIAAQERQRAADEAAAKKQKLNQYQDVVKSLKTDKILPYQKDDFNILFAESLNKIKKAIDAGDINAQSEAMNAIEMRSRELRAEYDAVDDYRKKWNEGKLNVDIKGTPDDIWTAKTRQEVAEKSGGDFKYNPQTGTINVYTTNKYNVADSWKKAGEKIPIGDSSQWEYVSIPGAGGKKVILYAPDENKYKQRLALEFDNDVDAQRNALVNYKRQNNLLGIEYDPNSTEYADFVKKARDQYINDGYEWGLANRSQIVGPPGKGIVIKNYIPGGTSTPDFGSISSGPYTFGRIKEDKTSVSNYGLNNVEKLTLNTSLDVTVPSAGIRSQDDGTVYSPSQVANAKLGAIVVAPIFNSKIGSSVIEGTQADQSEVDNPEYKGKFDYVPIFIGTAEAPIYDPKSQGYQTDEKGNQIIDKRNIYVPASQVKQAFINKLDDKDKAAFQDLYNQIEQSAKDKNAALKGGGSRITPPNKGGGSGGKKKPNKHGI